jgi:hypothetical protein
MSFVAAMPGMARAHLQGRDLIWMTVLGAAARASVTVEDVCAMAADLGGPSLVSACVDEMLRGGNLRMGSPRLGPDTRIVTTAAGLETLAMLSLATLPPEETALGRVARRVSGMVHDVLPPDMRLSIPGGLQHQAAALSLSC